MRLAQVSESWTPNEDQSWLGSSHGTETMDTITLDGSAFLTAFPDGIVPSGVVLGKITATGLYAPYSNAASDGTEVAAGLLFQTMRLYGTTGGTAVDTPASLFWHGEVVVAKLPTGNGLDTAGRADLPQIRFV